MQWGWVVLAALGCHGTERAAPPPAAAESGSSVYIVIGSPLEKSVLATQPASTTSTRSRSAVCAHPGDDVLIDKWDDAAETRCAIDDDASVAVLVDGRARHYDLGLALLKYSFEGLPTGSLDYSAPDQRDLTIAEPMAVAQAWVRAMALGKTSRIGFYPWGKRDHALLVPTAHGDSLLLSDTARPIREIAIFGVAEDTNPRLGDGCAFGGRPNAVRRVLFDSRVTAIDVATGKTVQKVFPSANRCPTDPHTLTTGLIGGAGRTVDQVRADADWTAVEAWLAKL